MKRINAKRPDRAGRTRVLILEDDLCLEALLARTLQDIDRNVEIYWVTTVEEAFADIDEAIKKGDTPYTLILADIYLRGASTGIDLWRICQSKIPSVPFIITSSMTKYQFLRLVEDCGDAPRFLPKPYRPDLWPDIWKEEFEKHLGGSL